MTDLSRRSFLRHLVLSHDSMVPGAGSCTLVCIFLRGGADTLNMFVPYGDDGYYKARPTIGIAPPGSKKDIAAASLKLDDFYAFHPKLAPLLAAYKEGHLAIVQGVGSDNPTGSHFDAQDQMEHGEAYGHVVGGGWLGRHLRTRAGFPASPLSAVAIGATLPEVLRGAPSASALTFVDEVRLKTPTGDPRGACQALSKMYGADVGLLCQTGKNTLDLVSKVDKLRGKQYQPENSAHYPDDSFGKGLREIARLIKAEVGLEAACLDLDGWDTHFVQGGADGLQAENIARLANGLSAFDADLSRYRNRVLTLVMTEFGRRIYENGSLGTDHGRGFALMLLGAKVKGGHVYGGWPGIDEHQEFAFGPSGFKIMHDYRSVIAETITGALGNRHIKEVFPGVKQQTLGFIDRPQLKVRA